jgi:hypothetical protein
LLNRVHAGQQRPHDVRAVEARIREMHLDTHSGARADDERRLLVARARLLNALDLYGEGSSRAAFRSSLFALIASPGLLLSPLVARSSWSFLMRSAIAAAVGPSLTRDLRAATRRVRSQLRLDPGIDGG